jgi:HNH endonuclease
MSQARTMPTTWSVVSYWLPQEVFEIDPYQPGCFICGLEDSRHCRYGEADQPRQRWLKVGGGLQRAHLVARFKGGPDAVENLIMLCQMCHKMMPNFADRQAAIDWALSGIPLINFINREIERLPPDLRAVLFGCDWAQASSDAGRSIRGSGRPVLAVAAGTGA